MRVIGLCGKSACGKGVFTKYAAAAGFLVIDCDAVYKEMVSRPSPCLEEIKTHFGNEVIKDNALDRRALAPIVFSDRSKLKLLNSITHKYVIAETQKIINNSKEFNIAIIDAPTLFESGMDKNCDLIIAITASDDICANRITERDGISLSEAYQRLSNQKNNEFYVQHCDIIINNDGTLDDYAASCKDIIIKIKEGSL